MIQAFRDLNRLREIAALALRYGFGEILERARLWEVLGRVEKQEERADSRESTARRFRLLLSDLGTTFIKLGQILSTRPDLLPAEYIQELSYLQDAVAAEPMAHVVREIEQSFGRPLPEVFEWVEEEPLASASIAQVHRARTLKGEEVVLKVQRSGIAERIRADLDLLYYAARAIEAILKETAVYSPVGIVEEFDASIKAELDFRNEARNIQDFFNCARSRKYLIIPKVHDSLCSRTVLTMEYIKGEKIRSIDLEKHDRKLLASRIIEESFQQLFHDRIFHGDPHPGNILVVEGGKIGLLDFGVVGRLTRQMQETLVLLMLAVSLRDADTVARLLYKVATPSDRTRMSAFRNEIESILDSYLAPENTLDQIDARKLVPQLLNLAVRYRIRIPKEYTLLSRASVAIEGLLRWLHPELNVGEAMLPYAKELLLNWNQSTGISTMGMRALLRLQTYATDVPAQLSQILLDFEGGHFKVNVSSEGLDKINNSIKGLGLVSFMGFLACGLMIGAFVSFSRFDFVVRGIPVMGGLALLVIMFLAGVVITWTLSRGKMKKMSSQRLFGWIRKKMGN